MTRPLARGRAHGGRGRRAFTLIEVLLAVVIAIGLLVVALYFYHQSADFRSRAIETAETLSAARLLMEKITSELRTARRHSFFAQSLLGESDFLQFIKTDIPTPAAWTGGELGRAAVAETDLHLVRYSLKTAVEGTNNSVIGINRTQEPLVEYKRVIENSASVVPVSSNAAPALLTESLRYLRFKFWDGAEWLSSWDKPSLPRGVEITIGAEPFSTELLSEEYPFELFRRVVYLPGSGIDDLPFQSAITSNAPPVAP